MPPDNEIITRQFKLLSRLIIILCRLPENKVIVPTGRDNALKCHRDGNIITQLFNTLCRLTMCFYLVISTTLQSNNMTRRDKFYKSRGRDKNKCKSILKLVRRLKGI